MKMNRSDARVWSTIIFNAFCSFVFAGDPVEMIVLRQGYEAKIDHLRQEAKAREQPVHEAYLRELDRCLKRLELEGRLEDVTRVRAERERMLMVLGVAPGSAAATAVVAKAAEAGRLLPVTKARLKSREELLAQAKARLNALQYGVAEKMTFKDFTCEVSKGMSFCEVSGVMTSEAELFRHTDLKAQVRFLMDSGQPPLLFDSGEVGLEPSDKKAPVFVGFNKGTRYILYRREGGGFPLSARITVFYFGVPVYEALWTKSGDASRYDREGKVPWWQDRNCGNLLNVNTATEDELVNKLGIKVKMARSLIESRPFLDKKEIEKRVVGVGPETYKHLEKSIEVR